MSCTDKGKQKSALERSAMQLALLCRTCQVAALKAKEGSTLLRVGTDAEGSAG